MVMGPLKTYPALAAYSRNCGITSELIVWCRG